MFSGFSGVTIDGADLAQFRAKLATKYTITAGSISPTVFRTRNSTSVWRLGYDAGLLSFDFPVDVYGDTKQETSENLAALTAALSGVRYAKDIETLTPLYSTGLGFVDINISDGYIYHVTLNNVGSVEWANDAICSVTYTMTGLRRKALETAYSLTSGDVFETYGTYPKIDCDLYITLNSDYITPLCSGSDRWVQVNLYSASRNQDTSLIVAGLRKASAPYWTCCYRLEKGLSARRLFTFSGTYKKITFADDADPDRVPGISEIEWSDFPYLNALPGAAVELKISSGSDPSDWADISSAAGELITVQYYPVYL